jgi:hypothetical protein
MLFNQNKNYGTNGEFTIAFQVFHSFHQLYTTFKKDLGVGGGGEAYRAQVACTAVARK